MMLTCWHPDPKERPKLREIMEFLERYEKDMTTREAAMFIKKTNTPRPYEVKERLNKFKV